MNMAGMAGKTRIHKIMEVTTTIMVTILSVKDLTMIIPNLPNNSEDTTLMAVDCYSRESSVDTFIGGRLQFEYSIFTRCIIGDCRFSTSTRLKSA
mmetsp:Transcript_1965/g.2432  ORF Transcript_1965/g.2432 Transcript_1965/m.2432 type:complete len:95 (+) Transcript_1965:2-286(+)